MAVRTRAVRTAPQSSSQQPGAMPQTGDRPQPRARPSFTSLLGTVIASVSVFSDSPVSNEVLPSFAFGQSETAAGIARRGDLRSVLSSPNPTYDDMISRLSDWRTINCSPGRALTPEEKAVLAKQAEDVLKAGVTQLWNYDVAQVKLDPAGPAGIFVTFFAGRPELLDIWLWLYPILAEHGASLFSLDSDAQHPKIIEALDVAFGEKMKVIHLGPGTTVLSGADRVGAFLKACALVVLGHWTSPMEMVDLLCAFLSSMGTSLLAAVGAQQPVLWRAAQGQVLVTTTDGKIVDDYKGRWNRCKEEKAREREYLSTGFVNPLLLKQRVTPGLKLRSWPPEKEGEGMEQWKREAREHWETMLRNREQRQGRRASKQAQRAKEQEMGVKVREQRRLAKEAELEEMAVNARAQLEERRAYWKEQDRKKKCRRTAV